MKVERDLEREVGVEMVLLRVDEWDVSNSAIGVELDGDAAYGFGSVEEFREWWNGDGIGEWELCGLAEFGLEGLERLRGNVGR